MNRVTVSQTAQGAQTNPSQCLFLHDPYNFVGLANTRGNCVTARVKLPLWRVCGQDWYLRERGCVMLGQDTTIVGANLAATRWVTVVFQGGEEMRVQAALEDTV